MGGDQTDEQKTTALDGGAVIFTMRQRMEGERLPRGYGIAWTRWDMPADVIFPVPFNWIARWVRCAYYAIAVPCRKNYLEQLELDLAAQYSKAHADMWGRFQQEVMRQALRHIEWYWRNQHKRLAQRIKEVRAKGGDQ